MRALDVEFSVADHHDFVRPGVSDVVKDVGQKHGFVVALSFHIAAADKIEILLHSEIFYDFSAKILGFRACKHDVFPAFLKIA